MQESFIWRHVGAEKTEQPP